MVTLNIDDDMSSSSAGIFCIRPTAYCLLPGKTTHTGHIMLCAGTVVPCLSSEPLLSP